MGKNKENQPDDPGKQYVEVAVALPVFKTLTYEVPPQLCPQAAVGKRVLVPVRNTRVTGYILDHMAETPREGTKAVLEVLDEASLFPPSMVPMFRWMADYYFYPIGEVVRGALPGGLTTIRLHTLQITEAGMAALAHQKYNNPFQQHVLQALVNKGGPITIRGLSSIMGRQVNLRDISGLEKAGLLERSQKLRQGRIRPKKALYVEPVKITPSSAKLSEARRKILSAVEDSGGVSLKDLRTQMPSAGQLVKKMATDGFVQMVHRDVYRDPFGAIIEPIPGAPRPTAEQASVLAEITGALHKGFKTYLLFGITGSGKTEVYMQAVAATLEKGCQAIVLVPEIALITQTEHLFRARFGNCVALLHSGLSQGERFDQWMRIVRQEAKIAIGARSAVFAPFQNLGLIVVDEEHDDSYKQESKLRYHARDVAVVRAKLQGAVALLGSATPSVQSYHNVRTRKYQGLKIKKRIDDQALPRVKIVDLRETSGYRRAKPFITEELKEAMNEHLARGEQVLLFLNRRGFANYPTCTQCGQPVRCKNCHVTMTLHQGLRSFKCHYCGHSRGQKAGCPQCGNPKIKLIGLGTERVEEKVKSLFPQCKIARMDRDTTTRKGALTTILKNLRNAQIDILIGTQMVAKGHHYPNVTLVGILCADLSLNFPDFRAGERTFQLLAQVAGRAGRGTKPGRVILQTFNPDHFGITTAKEQNFSAFFRQEIGYRRALGYPPFSRLVQILIKGKDKDQTARYAKTAGGLCRRIRSENRRFQKDVEILGPVSAPLSKIKKHYRWHILLKGKNTATLHDVLKALRAQVENLIPRRGCRVIYDIDPVNML